MFGRRSGGHGTSRNTFRSYESCHECIPDWPKELALVAFANVGEAAVDREHKPQDLIGHDYITLPLPTHGGLYAWDMRDSSWMPRRPAIRRDAQCRGRSRDASSGARAEHRAFRTELPASRSSPI